MIRPSKKWLAYFAVAGLCVSSLFAADAQANNIYSDENVSISSAVDRYIASSIAEEEAALEETTTTEVVEETEKVDVTLALGTSFLGATAPAETEEEAEETEEVVDCQYPEYANKAVVITNSYVNLRAADNTTSSVLGSVAPGEVVTVVTKGSEWSYVEVYGIEGFIRNDLLAFGDEAAEFVENDYDRIAVINTGSLRLREEPTTGSKCLAYLPAGGSYLVLSEENGWTLIQINNGLKGYVRNDYITITNGLPNNFSVVLEQEEEEETTTTEAPSTEAPTTEETPSDIPDGGSGITSCTGQDIANYAVQFEGNPYVYGGTSLTNGADCSGFVYRVYSDFGIALPRTATYQSYEGVEVSESELQPGDLVFYDHNTGSVEHVGIYIGGGQIIHASTERTGIIIADLHYSNVFKIRRIIY